MSGPYEPEVDLRQICDALTASQPTATEPTAAARPGHPAWCSSQHCGIHRGLVVSVEHRSAPTPLPTRRAQGVVPTGLVVWIAQHIWDDDPVLVVRRTGEVDGFGDAVDVVTLRFDLAQVRELGRMVGWLLDGADGDGGRL